MSTFKMINDGYPSMKKIMQGRKWVGRVVPHAEGGFLGKIGQDFFRAATEVEAFEGVVAKALGFKDVQSLMSHNLAAKQQNLAVRQATKGAMDAALYQGNFQPMLDLLSKK
jgi:hypothetical protein